MSSQEYSSEDPPFIQEATDPDALLWLRENYSGMSAVFRLQELCCVGGQWIQIHRHLPLILDWCPGSPGHTHSQSAELTLLRAEAGLSCPRPETAHTEARGFIFQPLGQFLRVQVGRCAFGMQLLCTWPYVPPWGQLHW